MAAILWLSRSGGGAGWELVLVEEDGGEGNPCDSDVPERVNDSRSSIHLFAFCSDARKSLAREDSYKRVRQTTLLKSITHLTHINSLHDNADFIPCHSQFRIHLNALRILK
jgi:hypothetical protein